MDAQLTNKGWYLTEDGVNTCKDVCENQNPSANDLIKVALNYDLRQIARKKLPENINSGQIHTIDGPIVLQIQKVRNISAPLANQESKTAPRMMKLNLTDGVTHCVAIELKPVSCLSLDIIPGTKICLKGSNIPLMKGTILLEDGITSVLGGEVEKLKSKWAANKEARQNKRIGKINDGGPPQFVDFDASKSIATSQQQKGKQFTGAFKKVPLPENKSEQTRKTPARNDFGSRDREIHVAGKDSSNAKMHDNSSEPIYAKQNKQEVNPRGHNEIGSSMKRDNEQIKYGDKGDQKGKGKFNQKGGDRFDQKSKKSSAQTAYNSDREKRLGASQDGSQQNDRYEEMWTPSSSSKSDIKMDSRKGFQKDYDRQRHNNHDDSFQGRGKYNGKSEQKDKDIFDQKSKDKSEGTSKKDSAQTAYNSGRAKRLGASQDGSQQNDKNEEMRTPSSSSKSDIKMDSRKGFQKDYDRQKHNNQDDSFQRCENKFGPKDSKKSVDVKHQNWVGDNKKQMRKNDQKFERRGSYNGKYKAADECGKQDNREGCKGKNETNEYSMHDESGGYKDKVKVDEYSKQGKSGGYKDRNETDQSSKQDVRSDYKDKSKTDEYSKQNKSSGYNEGKREIHEYSRQDKKGDGYKKKYNEYNEHESRGGYKDQYKADEYSKQGSKGSYKDKYKTDKFKIKGGYKDRYDNRDDNYKRDSTSKQIDATKKEEIGSSRSRNIHDDRRGNDQYHKAKNSNDDCRNGNGKYSSNRDHSYMNSGKQGPDSGNNRGMFESDQRGNKKYDNARSTGPGRSFQTDKKDVKMEKEEYGSDKFQPKDYVKQKNTRNGSFQQRGGQEQLTKSENEMRKRDAMDGRSWSGRNYDASDYKKEKYQTSRNCYDGNKDQLGYHDNGKKFKQQAKIQRNNHLVMPKGILEKERVSNTPQKGEQKEQRNNDVHATNESITLDELCHEKLKVTVDEIHASKEDAENVELDEINTAVHLNNDKMATMPHNIADQANFYQHHLWQYTQQMSPQDQMFLQWALLQQQNILTNQFRQNLSNPSNISNTAAYMPSTTVPFIPYNGPPNIYSMAPNYVQTQEQPPQQLQSMQYPSNVYLPDVACHLSPSQQQSSGTNAPQSFPNDTYYPPYVNPNTQQDPY